MRTHSYSKMNLGLKMTMLSLLGASLLAGCGIKGGLKTPSPVFGNAAKVDPERVPDADLDTKEDKDNLDLLDDDTDIDVTDDE